MAKLSDVMPSYTDYESVRPRALVENGTVFEIQSGRYIDTRFGGRVVFLIANNTNEKRELWLSDTKYRLKMLEALDDLGEPIGPVRLEIRQIEDADVYVFVDTESDLSTEWPSESD